MRSPPRACAARRPRVAGGAFKDEIVPVTVSGRKGDVVVDTDEEPGKMRPRQDPDAAPGVQEGRHDHRRLLVEDLRRRRRDRADVAPRKPRKRGLKPLARIVAHATPCAGAGMVHHRAGRRDRKRAGEGRLEGRRRRPVRGQRSLRLRRHGADAGPRHPARQAQRQRRRLRAGPSDRRQRRAPGGHPDPCAARHAAASAAWLRCASAAAKPPPIAVELA